MAAWGSGRGRLAQGVRRTGNEGSDPRRLGQRCETGRGTCGLRWLLHLKFIFSFSFTKTFYWSVVDLQCCVGFRYIAEWISYTHCIWQMHSNEWCSKGLVCVSTIIFFMQFYLLKDVGPQEGEHTGGQIWNPPLCVSSRCFILNTPRTQLLVPPATVPPAPDLSH